MVYIEYENETDRCEELEPEALLSRVAKEVLSQEELEEDVLVSLTLTDAQGIREVNREQRGIDAPTDVLSFPAQDPGAFLGEVELDDGAFDMETGALLLGDILINTERVYSQAEEYGHTPLRELAFLLAHSMLHLLGYDHMTPEEEREMCEKQEKVLTHLGITRENTAEENG